MASVKGGKISSKLAFVKEIYGPEVLQKVIASLPQPDQLQLKLVLDTGWYDFDLYRRVNEAVCKIAAGGDPTVYERMGWHSAESAFGKTYKVFLAKNVKEMLDRIESMHMLRNQPAELKVEHLNEGNCRVRVVSPKSTVEICRVNKGFYERAFQLAGAKVVVVRETKCTGKNDPECVFEISWQSAAKA